MMGKNLGWAVLVGLPLLVLSQPPPPLIAPSLPRSPDPSNFTFTGLPPPPGEGDVQLQLALSLFGTDLLPYTAASRDAIAEGFQQALSGALGQNNYRIQDIVSVSQEPAQGSLQYLFVNVTVVTSASLQQRLLDQLQTTVQNAQLAGQIRVGGLYNLQRLSVSSYSLSTVRAPAPSPEAEAPSPTPTIAVSAASPTPMPTIALIPVPGPGPTPAPSATAVGEGAAAFPASPVPAPGFEAPTTSPQDATPPPQPTLAVAPLPTLPPEMVMPPVAVPQESMETPSPNPVGAVVETPTPSPSPAGNPVGGFALTPIEQPVGSPPPTASPAAAAAAMPTLSLSPVETTASSPSLAVSPMDRGLTFAPTPTTPLSPAPSPSAFEMRQAGAPTPLTALSPSGQVNLTVQLNSPAGLNSTGAAALEAVLANLTGQGSGQVRVQGAPPAGVPRGRRLLSFEVSEQHHQQAIRLSRRRLTQQSNSVPITINASDYEQVLQNLGNLSSTNNLTAALQQAGLNITNAQITNVNGREVISAQTPVSPAPGPLVPVPAAQGNSWKNKAILWGVLFGTVALASLVAAGVCLGARIVARRVKRAYPPADAKGKPSSSPTSSSTDDLEEGLASYKDPSDGPGTTSLDYDSLAAEPLADQMVEVASHDEREDVSLLHLPPVTHYQGQFNYIVPSEGIFEEPDTAEESDSQISPVEEEKVAVLQSFSDVPPIAYGEGHDEEEDPDRGRDEPLQGDEKTREVQVQVSSHAVMHLIASGKPLADRFALEDGCIKGSDAIVVAAKDLANGGAACMCKFIISQAEFTKELHLHELFSDTQSPIPAIVQAFPLESFPRSGLPSLIMTEGGDYSLSQWHTQAKPPNAYQKRVVFHMACKALAKLHRKKIVLGSLTPDNVLWFEDEDAIKISSFSFWAFDGTPIPLHPALRYAPPETVQASARGKQRMPASFAIDVWSLGAIAFSIFARAPVFGSSFTDLDVIQCLLGNAPLPWEMDSEIFEMISNKDARNLVKNLLRKDPSSRWSMEQVLDSAFFNGLPNLPYKPGLAKNPSYPKQAVPRVTLNPLTPLRSIDIPQDPSPSRPQNPSPVRRLPLVQVSPSSSQGDSRVEDTARGAGPSQRPTSSRPSSGNAADMLASQKQLPVPKLGLSSPRDEFTSQEKQTSGREGSPRIPKAAPLRAQSPAATASPSPTEAAPAGEPIPEKTAPLPPMDNKADTAMKQPATSSGQSPMNEAARQVRADEATLTGDTSQTTTSGNQPHTEELPLSPRSLNAESSGRGLPPSAASSAASSSSLSNSLRSRLSSQDQETGPPTPKKAEMIGATIVSSSYDNAVYKDSLSPLNLSPANSTTVEGIQPHMLVGNPAYSADAGTLPTPSEEHHTPQPSTSALEMETSHTAESAWRPQQYQDLQAGHSTVADNPTAVDDAAPIATLIADLRKSSPLSTASEAMDMPERTLPNAHGEEEETRRTVKQPQSLSQSPGQRRRPPVPLSVPSELPLVTEDQVAISSPVAGVIQSPYSSRPSPSPTGQRETSALLRTLSIAGGYSRAGSIAGWESLEGYENAMSEMTSETSNLLNQPFCLKPIPASMLPDLRGSVVVMGITIEEVQTQRPGRGTNDRQLLEGVASGSIASLEAPMVPNKGVSLEHPVFMMRLGAKFVFRITLLAGSRRGGVPLGLTGPIKMRIGFARSDEGDSLEIKETEVSFSKWKGMALWDSSTPRVAQLAGRFGQQTRMVVTTDCRRKGADDILSIEHEIYSVMCSRGQKMSSSSTWSRGPDFNNALKSHQWVHEASRGALTICKVARVRNRGQPPGF